MRKAIHFTLIELLVVVCIMLVLLSLLMPALAGSRKKAKVVACTGNLRQQMLVCTMYASDWSGLLPYNYNPSTPQPADTNYFRYFLDVLYPNYFQNANIYYCPENLMPGKAGVSARTTFYSSAPGTSVITYLYFGWDQYGSSLYASPYSIEKRGVGKNIIGCDSYAAATNESNHGPPGNINTLYLDGHVKFRMGPLAFLKDLF